MGSCFRRWRFLVCFSSSLLIHGGTKRIAQLSEADRREPLDGVQEFPVCRRKTLLLLLKHS